MVARAPFHVAIVGGGLCGVSLALALKHRQIAFTIYEARSSFSEIGAGINLGPNGLRALRCINPSLGEKVYTLATRNLPPEEDTWMWFRYGAASGAHKDGEVACKISAPQTGSLTLHRQEFLTALAEKIGDQNVQFNKKLVNYVQDEQGVTLQFSDGTQDLVSVLAGCDGIHSRVRNAMFGDDNPISKPCFNHDGAYRAVIPIEKAVEAWGESGRQSQMIFGPNGYLMYYPINKGTEVNCGIWIERPEDWDEEDWVHKLQPQSFVDGRVILIGDGAHSMPPHQGAGASQAVEDAYVLAKVLEALDQEPYSSQTLTAALRAVDEIRRPRFTTVQHLSTGSGKLWYAFLLQKLEGDDRARWFDHLKERFDVIWELDIAGEAERAIFRTHELLRDSP